MDNAGVEKKQTREIPSVVRAMWDPFGFMQEMFGWGRAGDRRLVEVKETDDSYVCKMNVQLALPGRADVAHAKAELDKGELTLVVPKAAAAGPEASSPRRATAPKPEAGSSRRTARHAKGSGKARKRRRAR